MFSSLLLYLHNGPPSFVGQSEALQYQMGRLEQKVKQLDELHSKHLARPTLDDVSSEEADIQALTREVTEMFTECHHQIKSIRRSTSTCTGPESIITRNLVTYLVTRLQDATDSFRRSQGAYLQKMKAREENARVYFDEINDDVDPLSHELDMAWTKKDMLLLEDNTKFIHQREKEINNIVQSIVDLNVIFKDLATMVTEQGTIIDRIDYNIEHTHMRVEEGLKQIKKAAQYQKQDCKMRCIVILAVIVIILLFILIWRLH